MSCHIMTGGKQIKMKVDPATVWGEIICWEGHNELTDAAPLIHETIRHHNISGDLDLALEWRLKHLHLLCPAPPADDSCHRRHLLTPDGLLISWQSPEHVSSTLARPSPGPAKAQPAHSQLWRGQLFCFLVCSQNTSSRRHSYSEHQLYPVSRHFNADSAE